jgi:hypothetical protein
MAFVAGVLLMFLPEELSFRVLTKRLLREQEVIKDEEEEEKDAEGLEKEVDGGEEEKEREREPRPPRVGGGGGAGLRTLYEPGLSGLKSLLAQYDWLLARLAPEVSARLSVRGSVFPFSLFESFFHFFEFFGARGKKTPLSLPPSPLLLLLLRRLLLLRFRPPPLRALLGGPPGGRQPREQRALVPCPGGAGREHGGGQLSRVSHEEGAGAAEERNGSRGARGR